MSQDLDLLLSHPLPETPDNGFSNRVIAEIALQQLRRDRFKTEIYSGFIVLAVLVLPFTPLGQMLAASAKTASGMVLVGLTVSVILTFFTVKTVRR